jgi:NTE family protein
MAKRAIRNNSITTDTTVANSDSVIGGEENAGELEDGVALCLSGGGYRAMMFHTGAIVRLNEIGRAFQVDRLQRVFLD